MSYDDVASRLQALVQPAATQELYVEWLVQDLLAVGMRHDGAYSILLVGGGIVARLPRVAEALHSGTWTTPRGTALYGSVLALGSGSAFRIAIAAIASELVRLGAMTRSLHAVFADVESFIDLILRRSAEADELVVGLFGELLVLHQTLCAMQQLNVRLKDPTRVWLGWQRKSRDFRIGSSSIEVKTTQTGASRHGIAGLDQVDVHVDSTGKAEGLFLASVGIQKALSGQSVASLREVVLDLLGDTALDPEFARTQFLSKFAQYGQGGDVINLESDALTTVTFAPSFLTRLYDLSDPNVCLLRTEDVDRQFRHVDARSVRYSIDFPAQIPGSDRNPNLDLVGSIATMLQRDGTFARDE